MENAKAAMTHCVEIYSPRSGGAFFRSAPMTEEHAVKLAAEYNALLSPAEMEHTGARVVVKPKVIGKPMVEDRWWETRQGNRSATE